MKDPFFAHMKFVAMLIAFAVLFHLTVFACSQLLATYVCGSIALTGIIMLVMSAAAIAYGVCRRQPFYDSCWVIGGTLTMSTVGMPMMLAAGPADPFVLVAILLIAVFLIYSMGQHPVAVSNDRGPRSRSSDRNSSPRRNSGRKPGGSTGGRRQDSRSGGMVRSSANPAPRSIGGDNAGPAPRPRSIEKSSDTNASMPPAPFEEEE